MCLGLDTYHYKGYTMHRRMIDANEAFDASSESAYLFELGMEEAIAELEALAELEADYDLGEEDDYCPEAYWAD